jgi:hypothetical protein
MKRTGAARTLRDLARGVAGDARKRFDLTPLAPGLLSASFAPSIARCDNADYLAAKAALVSLLASDDGTQSEAVLKLLWDTAGHCFELGPAAANETATAIATSTARPRSCRVGRVPEPLEPREHPRGLPGPLPPRLANSPFPGRGIERSPIPTCPIATARVSSDWAPRNARRPCGVESPLRRADGR